MRLFLAVEPDRTAAAALGRTLTDVQNALGEAASGLRWTPAQNVHVTLHFLGEVDRVRYERLVRELGHTVAQAPFVVRFAPLEVFPGEGPPRVVWLSLAAPCPELHGLRDRVGAGVARSGWMLDERPFTPHLTLARVPDRERRRVARLREQLVAAPATPVEWTVDRVLLFRSDLSGPVPRYEAIHEIAMKLV
jgi:2'-5' RNA ligase